MVAHIIKQISTTILYLKVVVAQAAIEPAAVTTAFLKSGGQTHKDIGHPCRASQKVPCYHEPHERHASQQFRMDNHVDVCWWVQKRKVFSSSAS